MNFSEDWKSLWPITAVFAAPKLLSGPSATHLGPLLFRPCFPSELLLSCSLSFPIPPPLHHTTFRDNLYCFFRGGTTDEFIHSSLQDHLISDLLSELDGSNTSTVVDHVSSNQLHGLRCRDGSTFILFFPTGANADHIGYLGLSLKAGRPEIIANHDGDIFEQQDGYRHCCHRITQIAVSPVDADSEISDDSPVQGHVLATTMYSVNWFRVEIKVFGSDCSKKRPFLVPIAKQGFSSRIAHACWNPHFQEESVVLLENGELVCIDLDTKWGNKVDVSMEGDSGGWLSCQFGAQPWILIVASSKAVVVVDLRLKNNCKPTVLAKIENSDSYITTHHMENDRFVAFCSAGFDHFYFSVVSEHHLFLYDVRQPLFPLLTWDHGIGRPGHVSMFRLSELRSSSSEEFGWASDSGCVILVASFWNNRFKVFCYGPSVKGRTLSASSLYAWELPSNISLSGRGYCSTDDILKEEYSKDEIPDGVDWQLKKDVVLGFYVLPTYHFLPLSESNEFSGFGLIRLMSSGKLELQRYYASWDHFWEKASCEFKSSSKSQVHLSYSWDKEEVVSSRPDFLRLHFLHAYMNENLFETLTTGMDNPRAHNAVINGIICKRDLWELVNSKTSTSHTVSDAISDASFPANIIEIASRRALASLPPNLRYLTFSTYKELFVHQREFSLEFNEIPRFLEHKRLPPFLMCQPSRRGERWSEKSRHVDSVVGPVLPVPVLLTLRQIGNEKGTDHLEGESDENLLIQQCSMINKHVFPEISIADSGDFTGWNASQELQDENPFLIYEANADMAVREPHVQPPKSGDDPDMPLFPKSDTLFKDDNFTTFISGTHEPKDLQRRYASDLHMFDDLMLLRLDFDSPAITFSQDEHKVYKCFSRQFLKWHGNFKPFQDFCTLSKVPKKAL